MSWIPPVLLSGLAAFALTNVDDILLLSFLFSNRHTQYKSRHIIFGQYLGFLVILGLSLLGALSVLIIPQEWIGLLGFYPLLKGLYGLAKGFFPIWFEKRERRVRPLLTFPGKSKCILLLYPQVISIAFLTIANGADNLSIYIPLFARATVLQVSLLLLIFLLLLGVACLGGYALTRLTKVEQFLKCFAPRIFPYLLIGIGLYILSQTYIVSWSLQQFLHRW